VEEIELQFEWDSVDDFVRGTQDLAAPLAALLKQHPQQVRDEIWAAVADAVRPHAEAAGTVRLTNLALVAAGRG
jgi:hypothetical protein